MSAPDSTARDAAKPRRIRFGLRFKVILGLTIFNILGTAIFAMNHYRVEKQAIIAGVEQKLAAAARALSDMVPPGYMDRVSHPESFDQSEFDKLIRQLSSYCNDTGLIYLYSYHKIGDGTFRTTTTSATPEQLLDGSYSKYWEEPEAYPELIKAWDTNQPQYGESVDQWGHVYFLFAPFTTANGTRFVAGADIAISYLYQRLDASLKESILIGFCSFFVVFLFSFYIGSRVSLKITQLADYTLELAASDFQPVENVDLRSKIDAMPNQSRDEIAQLASSFIAMEQRLNNYLSELTETTATKERLRNELKIAGDIQLSMLPRSFSDIGNNAEESRIDLSAAVKPTKEAGGDLYDFFYLDDDHLCFMVGDVSDKGMPAALFMTVTITLLRAKAMVDHAAAPNEILRQTNELLIPQNAMCQFVTMFIGIINVRTGAVVYSDGGHNHPFIRRAGCAPEMLDYAGGIALGIMPGISYDTHQLQLNAGDTLFLYTDGVTDAIAADESFYGDDRLQRELAAIPEGAAASMWVETAMQSVHTFAHGHAQADDITVLALRFLPEQGAG